jgi:hypothetical protein
MEIAEMRGDSGASQVNRPLNFSTLKQADEASHHD